MWEVGTDKSYGVGCIGIWEVGKWEVRLAAVCIR